MSSRFIRKTETKSRFKRRLTLVPEIEEKPKRTKRRKSQLLINKSHSLPHEIMVPSPFGIYSQGGLNRKKLTELGIYTLPLILKYGKSEMRISGQKLNIKDQSVFIFLTQLAIKYKNLQFVTDINELCKNIVGKAYGQSTKDSIIKSLDRLYDARVEIRYSINSQPIIGLNRMISQFQRNKETNEIDITLDEYFQQIFRNKLLTDFIPELRNSLKGDIAKQNYLYGQHEVCANKKCNLLSLRPRTVRQMRHYLGADRDNVNVPLSDFRYRFKKGCEQLKKIGYLSDFMIRKEDDTVIQVVNAKWHRAYQKSLQGKIKYKQIEYKAKPESKPVEKEKTEPFFSPSKGPGFRLLKRLKEKIKDKKIINTGKKETKEMEEKLVYVSAIGKAIKNDNLVHEFISYLSDETFITQISSGTLNHKGSIFGSLIKSKYKDFEMPSDNAINKHFKLLTESDIEKEKREKKERAEEATREREKQKYVESIKWASDYIKENFKDLKDDQFDKYYIENMRNEIERKHNENWRRVFKEFVKEVESKHQENKDSRNYSYLILFKIGHRIWNETTK